MSREYQLKILLPFDVYFGNKLFVSVTLFTRYNRCVAERTQVIHSRVHTALASKNPYDVIE